jgi:hypothetical protein
MYLRGPTLVMVALALSLPLAARADHLTVSGRVVDAAGKPVADVELASFWTAENGAMKAYLPVTSDAQGRFSLKVNYGGRPVAVLGLDKQRKTGGLVSVSKQAAEKEVTVTLGPLVRVKGSFACKDPNTKLT